MTTYCEKSAKAFAILLHSWEEHLISTKVREIGMTNYPFETLDQEDIKSLNYAREALEKAFRWKKSWTVSVSLTTMPVPRMQWDESKTLVSQQVNLGWQWIQTIKQSTFKKRWQIQILFSIPIRNWSSNCKENSQLVDSSWLWIVWYSWQGLLSVKHGDRRFLVVANLSNEEQDLNIEGNVKSVLIENTVVQEVLEKQILAHGMLSVELAD